MTWQRQKQRDRYLFSGNRKRWTTLRKSTSSLVGMGPMFVCFLNTGNLNILWVSSTYFFPFGSFSFSRQFMDLHYSEKFWVYLVGKEPRERCYGSPGGTTTEAWKLQSS